jgi:hypothetical protein
LIWRRWTGWLLRVWSSPLGLSILHRVRGYGWRLGRLNTLVALRIEAGVYSGFSISELLLSTLQRSMLSLLPCRNIWRWWHVNTWHGIRVRRHICLNALACERWRYVGWLLLIRAHDGRLLRCSLLSIVCI